jgi:hypothetical protein
MVVTSPTGRGRLLGPLPALERKEAVMTDAETTDQSVSPDEKRGAAISHPWLLLIAALALGIVCEALLHGQPPGVGYAVASAVAVAIWVGAGIALGIRPSVSGAALLIAILFFSAMVAVRASPALQALNVLTGAGLALMMAAVYLHGGLAGMSLTDDAAALFVSALALVVQPFLLIFQDLPRARRKSDRRGNLAPVLLGLILAAPLLLVFGALFAAADAVFAGYMRQAFSWLTDFPQLLGRVLFSLVLAWMALGLARRAFTAGDKPFSSEGLVSLDFLRLGAAPAIIVLALVNALFLGFVAVQAVYLFGGADTLVRTGMTHSEYARRGFFELVTVATLVLGLVLLLDWLARFVDRRARLVISLLHGLLVLLTLVILASALVRMRLYQGEFGLTGLRFYTTAFMAWLAVVLVWLAATVLPQVSPGGPGRRRFAFGALVTGLALVALLDLANPDAWIARVNLDRAASGAGQPLDAAYLTEALSLDAVPTLVDGLAKVPDPGLRTKLACGLRAQAAGLEAMVPRLTWRGGNLGNAASRRALAAALPGLEGVSCPAAQ